jgi:hypothetical protein
MQMARSNSRTPHRLAALCTAVVTCLFVGACGDDGTEGLSSCPGGHIQADKYGIQHCAARPAGAGGMLAASPRAGAGSSQQPKPAAGGGAPAANSGGTTPAAAAPPIPRGGIWTCVQVGNTCSCAMTDTALDACTKPLPGCCMLVRAGAKYSGCVCYADNSVECSGAKQDGMNFVPVSACPPP